jgi:hypothetical protein
MWNACLESRIVIILPHDSGLNAGVKFQFKEGRRLSRTKSSTPIPWIKYINGRCLHMDADRMSLLGLPKYTKRIFQGA